jgi:stage 0 sporulation protein B (sporulation initiation phosphotransferase)
MNRTVQFGLGIGSIAIGWLISYFSLIAGIGMSVLGCLWLVAERITLMKEREQAQQSFVEQMNQQNQERLLAIISRYRHDWMNDFQILIGNLRLKKFEAVEGFVQKVIQRAREESRVSRLADLDLMVYFMEFNSHYSEILLTLDIEESYRSEGTVLFKEHFERSLHEIIEAYRHSAIQGSGEPNRLHISVGMQGQCIRVTFTFSGQLVDSAWQEQVEEVQNKINLTGPDDSLILSFQRLEIENPSPLVPNKAMVK